MPDMIKDVREFHQRFGVPVVEAPSVPSDYRRDLRMRLITEEFNELKEALGYREMSGDKWLSDCDLPETADAIADLIYVLVGTAHEFGIPLGHVWNAVHATNMAKVGGGEDSKGKIQKPPGWVAPDVAGILKAHGWNP
jgi:predicted HAD superfamily Cof-like phosphohydrolase